MNLEHDKNGYLTFKNAEGKMRVFSGIQPSGEVHIGNYLGAISNWATMLDEYECIFCIVDHAVMVLGLIKPFTFLICCRLVKSGAKV